MALKHAEPVLAVDAASGRPGDPPGSGSSELARRIWFTLGALALFRLGSFVPIPGLNGQLLAEFHHLGTAIDVFGHAFPRGIELPVLDSSLRAIDEFSGGALGRLSIFSLGVMPYITALIFMQVLAAAFPRLERRRTGTEADRQKHIRDIRRLALVFSAIQAYGVATILETLHCVHGAIPFICLGTVPVVFEPGPLFRVTTVLTLAGGTMLLVWLAEQISARGLGNGFLMIILAGLLSKLPVTLAGVFELVRTAAMSASTLSLLAVVAIGTTVVVVFMEQAARRVLVDQPAESVGRRMHGGQFAILRLRLNPAGILPPVLAALVMPVAVSFAYAAMDSRWLGWLQPMLWQLVPGQPAYLLLFALLVALACITFQPPAGGPQNLARTLESSGSAIRGVPPGKATATYLAYVQDRLTTIGAVYLAAICVVAEALVPRHFWFFPAGGVGVVIVVLVTQELAVTIHHHLTARRT